MQQSSSHPINPGRQRRDGGAMLLAVLFMMAMMVLMALAVAPAFMQQAKRDREEEMIHRGTEYERAVRRYYRKFGRYPANLEQLENTNQLRFLRKRYADPLTKDGQWKLLHYGDIQTLFGAAGFGVPGQQAGVQGGIAGSILSSGPATGTAGGDQGASTATAGAQQSGTGYGNQPQGSAQPGGASPLGAAGGGAAGQSGVSSGQAAGQTGGVGGSQTDTTTGQSGTNNSIFGTSGVGGQTFGGGAIVGVASKSKDPTIRIYNKKKTYDEWLFVYSPMMERQNMLMSGPFNGQMLPPAQVGTPAGQLNQGQGGVQTGAPGVQLPQQNQQQNQPLTPPAQFPPDQTQPPPQ